MFCSSEKLATMFLVYTGFLSFLCGQPQMESHKLRMPRLALLYNNKYFVSLEFYNSEESKIKLLDNRGTRVTR